MLYLFLNTGKTGAMNWGLFLQSRTDIVADLT